MRPNVLWIAALLLSACAPANSSARQATTRPATFHNPICTRGADPQVFLKDGIYYYVKSGGRQSLVILKSTDVTEMNHATRTTVWTAPAGTPHSRELWAPELHQFNGKWYIYYAADDGSNDHHRMFCLENPSPDPTQGKFEMKGKIQTDPGDHWAIDGTVFDVNGKLYMAWSGWAEPATPKGETAHIYIASMSNPWTLDSDRVALSDPKYDWERHYQNPPEWHNQPARPVFVNEGPAVLEHSGKLFLTYSGSGCWTPYYCLGILTADANANLLDPKSWTKSDHPVFQQSPEDHVYGTGHNSFFKSPDGKEDWLIYHANDKPNECGGPMRSPRIQKITWNPDGTPNFGKPLPPSAEIAKPSGL